VITPLAVICKSKPAVKLQLKAVQRFEVQYFLLLFWIQFPVSTEFYKLIRRSFKRKKEGPGKLTRYYVCYLESGYFIGIRECRGVSGL